MTFMGRDWKQWAADKGLKKWFRRDNFIVLVLTGILLVIIALPTKKEGKQEEGDTASGIGGPVQALDGTEEQDSVTAPLETNIEEDMDLQYAAQMEERLTQVLTQMADVGEVRVMITLKASRELVVEKEQPVRRSATNESDSLGGNRTVNEVDSDESTVYRTDGSLNEPYVVKTLPPQIEGVLVVAEGAGNGTVNRTIVEVVQALFGIEAHKVKVVRMEVSDETPDN